MSLIKISNFHASKDINKKMKRQPTKWKKIFTNNVTSKGLVSTIYSLQLYIIRTTTQSKKQGGDLNRHFSKEDLEMPKRHMKRCSTSLIIREMHIKIAMSDHLTTARMAIIKKPTNRKCWRGSEEKGTLLHCWQEGKLVQPYGAQYGGSLKN